MRKKVSLIITLLALVFCAHSAFAADFSNAPLGDICYIQRLVDGRIMAMDVYGKVAVFDYSRWEVINPGPGTIKITHIEQENKILAVKSNDSAGLQIYDVNSNLWTRIQGINNGYYFIKNGEYYGVNCSTSGTIGLYRYNGSQFSIISTGPTLIDGDKKASMSEVAYDTSTGKLFTYSTTGPSLYDDWIHEYNFTNNTWILKYDFPDLTGSLRTANNHYIYTSRASSDSWLCMDGSSFMLNKENNLSPQNSQLFVLGTSKDSTYKLYLWNGSTFAYENSYSFTPNTACYDKFGFLVVAGDAGKVVVRDSGGIHTDSSLYSDLLIADISKNVNDAKINAANAYEAANDASTNAQTAMDRSWYAGTYGGPQESVADTAGYIRNTQLPNLETKINNLQTSVTTIQSADNLPPSVELDTVSGAKATSSSSIQLVVAASDNKSSTFTYSVNGGGYSSLPANGKITISIPAAGPNTIMVRVKDEAGNVTTKTIKIWRLS